MLGIAQDNIFNNISVYFPFELVAVVSQCTLCHSYRPYATVLFLLEYSLSNSLTTKVSLVLVCPVNKCVCESVVRYSNCLAKE